MLEDSGAFLEVLARTDSGEFMQAKRKPLRTQHVAMATL